MTRLLIVGPPGAGKGTQSVRLTEAFGIPAIATGDIFRANIKNQTPLGVEVKAIIDAGDFVPDSLTNDLVANRLREQDCESGFLLDGYPRTIEQLHFLDALLAAEGTALDAVVQLVADEDEIVSRLLKRAHEEGRTDDTPETIRYRQSLYQRETAPLIAVYKERGLVIEIDALGEVDDVADRITAALTAREIVPSPEVSRRTGLYKKPDELAAMVRPGLVTAAALAAVRAAITVGVTTLELDAIAEASIRAAGGIPNFALEPGYSHTLCTSINDAVVHGVPSGMRIAPGDLVSIDCGALVGGWNGDAAFSTVVPDDTRPELVQRRTALVDATERALWSGIAAMARAVTVNEIGEAVEASIEELGEYGIIEDFTGHGIGRSMHEDPAVFNFRVRGGSPKVLPGLVLAIEPMITLGGIETHELADGWTQVTDDRSDAAHWEHSVARHAGGIWVLTAEDGGAAGLAPFGVTPEPIRVR